MSKKSAIPEVVEAIKEHFITNGINQVHVAQTLEISPQAVSQQLKLPFGKRAANKWAKEFGFDAEFLRTGKGELVAETPNSRDDETTDPCGQEPDPVNNEDNWKDLYESAHKQNNLLHQLLEEARNENALLRQMLKLTQDE